MLQKLKNKKVLVGFLVISVLSLVYIYYSSKKTVTSTTSQPPSFTSNFPTPRPLQIISSYPNSGKFILTFPVTALTFQFNQQITPNQVRVDVTPSTKLVLSLSPDKYYLNARPEQPWKFNIEYKIEVYGLGGVKLAENIVTFLDPSKNFNQNDFGDPPDPNYKP